MPSRELKMLISNALTLSRRLFRSPFICRLIGSGYSTYVNVEHQKVQDKFSLKTIIHITRLWFRWCECQLTHALTPCFQVPHIRLRLRCPQPQVNCMESHRF